MPRKLRDIAPLIRTIDTRTTPLPPRFDRYADARKAKIKNPVYDTPQFRAWRTTVIQRAKGKCQAIDEYGNNCPKQQPQHRMYADHIVELKDGGSLLDINNGQCLCSSHHELKTIAARRRRNRTGGYKNV
jgi:hypothetical protein